MRGAGVCSAGTGGAAATGGVASTGATGVVAGLWEGATGVLCVNLGALCAGVEERGAVEVLPVEVRPVSARRDWRWLGAERSVTIGARLCPAEIGSEEIPMCWLVSWLVAHVIPAVSTMPSSAATPHSAV